MQHAPGPTPPRAPQKHWKTAWPPGRPSAQKTTTTRSSTWPFTTSGTLWPAWAWRSSRMRCTSWRFHVSPRRSHDMTTVLPEISRFWDVIFCTSIFLELILVPVKKRRINKKTVKEVPTFSILVVFWFEVGVSILLVFEDVKYLYLSFKQFTLRLHRKNNMETTSTQQKPCRILKSWLVTSDPYILYIYVIMPIKKASTSTPSTNINNWNWITISAWRSLEVLVGKSKDLLRALCFLRQVFGWSLRGGEGLTKEL